MERILPILILIGIIMNVVSKFKKTDQKKKRKKSAFYEQIMQNINMAASKSHETLYTQKENKYDMSGKAAREIPVFSKQRRHWYDKLKRMDEGNVHYDITGEIIKDPREKRLSQIEQFYKDGIYTKEDYLEKRNELYK